MGWKAAVEADAIGEQQLKRTQSESSSRSGCNWGAADEVASSSRTCGAAAEADTIRKNAAAEADAIGEQQLCTESCPASDYSRRQTRGK